MKPRNHRMLPKIRCTVAQKMALIDYMWDHRQLARYEYDPHTAETEWFRLAETLNRNGSVKTVEKWKVTWRDLKRKALREVQVAIQNNTSASEAALKIREILMSSADAHPREHGNFEMSPSLTLPHASIHLTPEDSYQGQELPGDQDQSQYLEPEDRSAINGLEAIECTPDFSSDSSLSISPMPKPLTKLRSNHDQINALVDCMAMNSGMAFGNQQTPKKIADWKRLRQLLNKMGPEKRTAAWQQSWRDLKRNAVERNNTNSKNNSAVTQKIVQIIEAHAQGTNSTSGVSAEDDLHLRLPAQVKYLLQAETDRPEAPSNQVSPVQRNVSAVNVVPLRQYRQRLKPKTRSTNTQICALVDYMEKHPALAVARSTAGDTQCPYIAEWRRLSNYLNRIGSTRKSAMAWKRTWRDLKKAAKKEPSNERNFNLNQRIIQILKKTADAQQDDEFDMETADLDAQPFAVYFDQMSPGQHSGCSSPVQSENAQSDQDRPSKITRKKARCTNAQKHALVDYMCTHPALATSNYIEAIDGDPHYAEWRQLSKYLNKIGTAKSTISWKKTWRDLKLSVLKKKWSDETLLGLDRKILEICEKNPKELNTETEQEFDILPDRIDSMPVLYLQSPKHTKPELILCDPSHDDPANQESENSPKQSQKSPGHLEISLVERSREMSPDQRSVSPVQLSEGFEKGNKQDSAFKKNRSVRCTPTQIYALVRYMELHPSLARAKCLNLNTEQDPHYEEWRRLCRYLNNADTTVAAKSVTRWKCTWRTLVTNARRKDRKRSRWNDRVSRRILQILNENEPEANEKNVEEHVKQPNEDYVYPPSPTQCVMPDPLKCEPIKDIERSRENAELPKLHHSKRRSSNLQIRALADFMISHPEVATRHPSENIPAWVKITRHLNGIGLARSMKAWCQTWRDLKIRVLSRAHAKDPSSSLQGFRERKLRKILGVTPRKQETDIQTETDGETIEESSTKPESEVAVAPRAPSPRTVLYNLAEILARNGPMNENNPETNNKKTTPETSVSNETNDILRELVLELKRSNELKAEQNCYLKDILQHLKTPKCSHASQNTNIPTPIDECRTDNIDVLDVKKQEADNLDEDIPNNDEDTCNGVANKDGSMLLMPSNMQTQAKSNQDKNGDPLYVVCARKRR
ncbi:uncharacterized protein LOC133529757 isoform X2 [Cydia pomonella]|uniref:uncharacterized protein LOC133529757 isoform X2 n=1 Tax=Cydia pomonella TaxID=82600 RepID=UPI002ADD3372|nr:uncharacterized protein LOC133529757 isoform X2 [Cydia pomonella]